MVYFIKFCLVGASGTIITLSTEYILTEFFLIWYGLSLSLGWVLGFLNNFFWNKNWTFDFKEGVISRQLGIYFISTTIALIANLLMTIFLTEILHFWYFFSSIISVSISTIINYLLVRYFVFSPAKEKQIPLKSYRS